MNDRLTRRSFLTTAGACGALATSPTLAHTKWRIKGSERGVLRIVFYTDVHARTDRDIPTALAMAADAINSEKADIVLGGGDLIDGGFFSTREQVAPRWNAYDSMARAINGEHRTVIGNHDLVAADPADGFAPAVDPRLDYKQRLSLDSTYGSFEALGYRFVLLDSIRISGDEYGYRGSVSRHQIEWVEEELSSIPKDKPIILVLHVPLLTSFFSATRGATFQANSNTVVVNNADVLSLSADHNLVLVLQGHLHVSELLRWRGTTFITGGAICAGWWAGTHFGTKEGFNTIVLQHDRIEWEYRDFAWLARASDRQ